MLKQSWKNIELILQKFIKLMRSAVLDAGNFELTYSGNESNSFGTSFPINRKYKQAIMNF